MSQKAVYPVIGYVMILTFFSYQSIAGNTASKLKVINYENTSGEKAATTFLYNSKGMIYRGLWEMSDQSRSSVNYYEYDAKKQLVSVFREFSNGLKSYELYTYDSLGNKLAEYYYRSDTLSGYATYEYKDKFLVKADCRQYKGWLDGEIFYKYDTLNRLSSATIDKDKKSLGEITYSYDSAGNLSREVWFMYGWWTQTFNYQYEAVFCNRKLMTNPLITNGCNYRILKENYNYNFKSGGASSYSYDTKGDLANIECRKSDGAVILTTFGYDAAGKIIIATETGADGSKKIYKYTYDDSDRVVLRTYWISDTISGFESYVYDNYNRLVKAYFKNYSERNLTGYLSFSYDNFDRIEKAIFTPAKGMKADLLFTYNNNNILTELLWNFFDGTFQKYLYEVEKYY